jgi:hypothetical protein
MLKESVDNIFYEKVDNDQLGIVKYDDDGEEKEFYQYLRGGDEAKDSAVIVRAAHPLYKDKMVLLIMGFSDLGTQYSAALLTGSNECGNVNPEKEVGKLNDLEINKRIEAVVLVGRKGKTVNTWVPS